MASLFDPLGLILPVVCKAKLLFQKACMRSAEWDDPLDKDILQEWTVWRQELKAMPQITLPRVAAHPEAIFSDASCAAYACAAYAVDSQGDHLIMSKTNLAPSKTSMKEAQNPKMSITRLELLSSVLATCTPSESAFDEPPITPNMLDVLRTSNLPPLNPEIKVNESAQLRYRRLQEERKKLQRAFWKRFREQYLFGVRVRKGPMRGKGPEPKVGQVVLLHDPHAKNRQWRLAVIVEIRRHSVDGLIRELHLKTPKGILRRHVKDVSFLEAYLLDVNPLCQDDFSDETRGGKMPIGPPAEGSPALLADYGRHVVRATNSHLSLSIPIERQAQVAARLGLALKKAKAEGLSGACTHSNCPTADVFDRLILLSNEVRQEWMYLCRGQGCDVPEIIPADQTEVGREREDLGLPTAEALIADAKPTSGTDPVVVLCSLHMGFDQCPSDRLQPRHKRQLFAAIFGALGFGLSLYDHAELQELRAMERTEEGRVEALIKKVSHQQIALHQAERAMELFTHRLRLTDHRLLALDRHETLLELLLDVEVQLNAARGFLTALWEALSQRRLNPRLFSVSGLQRVLDTLRWQVGLKDLKFIGTSLTHLLDAPLSWITEDKSVHLYFHLPAVETEDWTFYRWLAALIHYGNGSRYHVAPHGNYLAVSPDARQFRELTTEDFQRCNKIEGKYMCPAGVVTELEAGSCLASLYRQSSFISKVCSLVEDHAPTETLIQVSRNQTVIIQPPGKRRTEVTVSCPGADEEAMRTAD